MVYVGPSQGGVQLWLREHDQLAATPVPGTAGAGSPFFSPDGSQLGFLVQGTRLRTVALGGGPTVSLSDSVNSSGGDWATDGHIYIETDSGIARLPASGGPLELLYNMLAHQEAGAEFPVVLPGAKGMLFRTRRPNQAIGDFQIVAMPLPKPGEKPVQPHVLTRGVYARYSPTGHLLVVTGEGKLVAFPFDPGKLAITGAPVSLLEGIGIEIGGFSTTLQLSNSGTLVYTTGAAARPRQAVWVSREGLETPVDSSWEPPGTIAAASLSPDGTALAAEIVAQRQQRALDQAAAERAGVAGHLRRHGQPPAHLVGRRAVADLHRQRRRQRRPGDAAAGRRDRGRPGAGQVAVRVRPGERDAGRQVGAGAAVVPRGGGGRHLRDPRGRFDADAAGDGAGYRDRADGVARRAVARVHLERVGAAGGVRAAVPRRGVGAVAGVGGRRARPDVVAQRQGAVLLERRRTR